MYGSGALQVLIRYPGKARNSWGKGWDMVLPLYSSFEGG